MIAAVPVAGWYRDPSDAASMRWWSGESWTGHVQPITPAPPTESAAPSVAPATPGVVAAPAVAPSASPGARWTSNYADGELEIYTSRGRTAKTAQEAPRSQLTADGRTLLSFDRDPVSALEAPVPNGVAWTIAAAPILALLLGAAVGGLEAVGAIPVAVPSGALGLPLVIAQLLLAVRDWRTLRAAGLPAASSAWALLGPLVYLARRTWVLRGRPRIAGPLILSAVLAALQAAAIGAVIALFGLAVLTGGSSGGADAAGAGGVRSAAAAHVLEDTIEQDLVSKGQNWQVDCSGAAISVAPDSSFQCAASAPDGRTGTVAVVVDAQRKMTYSLTSAG